MPVLIAAAAQLAWASPALACSIRGQWAALRSPELNLLVRPVADTLEATAGDVSVTRAMGHFGPGVRAGLFGQVMTVEEVPRSTAAALPRGTTRVVFVPWDYGPDCRPVAWTRSARWVGEAATVLIKGQLRAREHWVGDLPTFDVFFTQFAIYRPEDPRADRNTADTPAPLEPRHLMHLLDSLAPFADHMDTLGARAIVHRLYDDSALRDRHPIRSLIDQASGIVHAARQRAIRAPFAGTLRLEFSFNDGPWRRQLVRTDASPTSFYHADDLSGATAAPVALEPRHPLDERPYAGYELYVHTGHSTSALPRTCEERGSTGSGYGYIVVPIHARDASRTAGRWRVAFEEPLIAGAFTAADRARADSLFPPASVLDRIPGLQPLRTGWDPQFDITVRRRRRNGLASVEGETTQEPFGRIRVRGTQLDTVTVTCP